MFPEMISEERSGYSVSTDPESASVDLKPSDSAIKKERSFSQVDTRQKKGFIPLFFERASSQWWKPTFDSEILEEEFQRFTAHNKRRLVHALMYVSVVCFTWGIFFGVLPNEELRNQIVIGAACDTEGCHRSLGRRDSLRYVRTWVDSDKHLKVLVTGGVR